MVVKIEYCVIPFLHQLKIQHLKCSMSTFDVDLYQSIHVRIITQEVGVFFAYHEMKFTFLEVRFHHSEEWGA